MALNKTRVQQILERDILALASFVLSCLNVELSPDPTARSNRTLQTIPPHQLADLL
jgi:hypothetical protein